MPQPCWCSLCPVGVVWSVGPLMASTDQLPELEVVRLVKMYAAPLTRHTQPDAIAMARLLETGKTTMKACWRAGT